MTPPAELTHVRVEPHPLLAAIVFETVFPSPLGELPGLGTRASFEEALAAPAPVTSDDATRSAIRDLLRWGGYKPTGRGKPASEYLLRAVTEGALRSINRAVDAANVASLHSGLPISVVDADRLVGAPTILIAPKETEYVFNASGQTIDVGGLLCLGDDLGPTANGVKDSERTKTRAETTRTLSVIWASRATPNAEATFDFYREMLEAGGAATRRIRETAP